MTCIFTSRRFKLPTFLLTTTFLLILFLFSNHTHSLHLSITNPSKTSTVTSTDLTYCSFNVQVFGKKKMQNDQVVEILLKILGQCDLTLIMEIRDASGEAIKELISALNGSKYSGGKFFKIEESSRLGRSSSKEQYGYIYDSNKVFINSTFQYPVEFDQFERPPFSVVILPAHKNSTTIRGQSLSSHSVFISGIHTSPKLAVQEIDSLYNVYEYYYKKNRIINANIPWLLSGDFNAGCSYVKESDWKDIRLRTDSTFKWLIKDDQRTMVKTQCPYDRFVIAGQLQYENVQVVNFKEEFGLTQSLAEAVSDHFPIRMTIKNWLS